MTKPRETTFQHLLEMARVGIRHPSGGPYTDEAYLCRALVDLLGEDQPCGAVEPIVKAGERIELVDVDGHYTPEELRAHCAMWLRAADKAEELAEEST